ncbi:MAG: AI-2E family transporter [Dehalococcoidia bacterium]
MVRIEFSLRQSLVLLGLLAAVWLVVKIWSVLVLVALALLLAGALMPFVDALWRRTHRRTLAVAIVALAVLLGLAVLLLAVAPTLVAQGRDLWERWPQLQERAAAHAGAQGWTDLRDRIAAFSPTALIGPRLFDTSRTVVTAVVEVVTVFVLAIYVLLDARRLKQFLYFSTPRSWHRHIRELLPALQRVVGGYIRGQAITSAAIFAFTGATLAILGAPNAVALAAIAALLDLIPMIGVFLMMVPVVTATLQVSLTTTILAVGLMLVYQQVEDRLLLPRVYGKTLRLPTLVVVLALLVGAEVMGADRGAAGAAGGGGRARGRRVRAGRP